MRALGYSRAFPQEEGLSKVIFRRTEYCSLVTMENDGGAEVLPWVMPRIREMERRCTIPR